MKNLANAEDVAELHARVGELTPADQRVWGTMTVDEMVCHVRDAYEAPLGQRAVSPVKAPPIPRPVLKWLALRAARKWPEGVPRMPEVDQKVGGTRPVEFAADVRDLLRKLDELAGFEGTLPEHPIFRAMTRGDWMRWGYLHADHHLRQFGR